MKTIEESLDILASEVMNSNKTGIPLKLFISKKILEANDTVSKYFLNFRKKNKKKKKKNIIVEEKIIIKDKEQKDNKKEKKEKKGEKEKKEKKERVVEEVSNLSLGRLSSLLKEVDDFNLENNN